MLGELPRSGVIHEIELERGRAAEAVHQQQHLAPLLRSQVCHDGMQDLLRNGIGRHQRNTTPARFTVNSHTDFHFVFGDVERRPPDRGHGATGERHAHGARHVIHRSAKALQRRQAVAPLRRRAQHLLDDHRPRHAAPTHAV